MEDIPQNEIDIPRHQIDRKGYTKLQWEERFQTVDRISKQNPRLPPFYIELIYDTLWKKNAEEIKELVETY